MRNPQAFVTISEDQRKSAAAVIAHLKSILYEFPQCNETLHIVSDSAASQYRNMCTMSLMKKLCEELNIKMFNWNFTEAGHGKSAADGVGAAVKRALDNEVVCKLKSVQFAADVPRILSRNESSILCKIVTADDINEVAKNIPEYLPRE